MQKNLVFLLLFRLALAISGSETQEQWDGGDGVPGPVEHWYDDYDTATDINHGVPLYGLRLGYEQNYQAIVSVYYGASDLDIVDVDGDEDMDILHGPSGDWIVTWMENLDGSGTRWNEHTIDDSASGYVRGADFDKDGDSDVMIVRNVSEFFVTLWENLSGDGNSWQYHIIDDETESILSPRVADMDDDGDLDLVGTTYYYGTANVWWENTGMESWPIHLIGEAEWGMTCIGVDDVDGDEDLDVVGVSNYDETLYWWENLGDAVQWAEHVIGEVEDPGTVCVSDLDMDGDADVLSGEEHGGPVSWWENTTGGGNSWVEHVIGGDGSEDIEVTDYDEDGDNDVVVTSNFCTLTWWENADGSCDNWTEQILDFFRPVCIEVGDMDTDGTDEILGGSDSGYYLRWWEPIEYKGNGNLVSSILDIEDTTADWEELNWTVDLAPDTACTVDVRSSDDYSDMGDWVEVDAPGDDLSDYITNGDRYFQYRVSLSTQDTGNSPHFREIEANWLIPTAPVLIATEPYSGESDVPVGFRVLLAFDVEMDPDPSLLQFTCDPDPGGWSVEWTTYNRIALLTHGDFEPFTTYTFELTDAVSKYGLHLGGSSAPNPFSFTTGDDSGIMLTELSAFPGNEGVLVRWDCTGDALAAFRVLGCEVGENPESLHEAWLPSTARLFLHRGTPPGSTVEYWVEVLDARGIVHRFGPTEAVTVPSPEIVFALESAYPNPARDEVHFLYSIPVGGRVSLTVYDLSGRRIATPVDAGQTAGRHEVSWDCSSAESGVYLVRLSATAGAVTSRVVVAR
jgi:hypothetical protein